jgi:hypothetical protein
MRRRDRNIIKGAASKPPLTIVRRGRPPGGENSQGDSMMSKRKFQPEQRRVFRRGREARQGPHSAPAAVRLFQQHILSLSNQSMPFSQAHDRRSRSLPRQTLGVIGTTMQADRTNITSRFSRKTNERA